MPGLDPGQLAWIINHLGEERPAQRGAVVPPIYQSAMFCFESVAQMREQLTDELANPFYTRGNNPTVEVLRRKLAALEGAEDCLVFGSGGAAIAAGVLVSVEQGDEVLCVDHPYNWTGRLLGRMLPRFGVSTRFVAGGSVAGFEAAVSDRTRLIVLESPNSLTFEQQDVAGIAAFARERGIRTLCDNSYATPLTQQPLALGCDLVAHSVTKYINGHSDVVAGALCGSSQLIREVFDGPFMTLGGILGPHDAWLVIRGLRTLPLRLERVTATTRRIVSFLADQPRVARVHYPADTGTGLFSIELDARPDEVERFCDALTHFLMTCSWGGHESLVFPMCALATAANYAGRQWPPPALVRFSVGLEPADLLIADLEQALACMSRQADPGPQ